MQDGATVGYLPAACARMAWASSSREGGGDAQDQPA